MTSLRLTTLKTLQNLSSLDAMRVLDWHESQYQEVLYKLSKTNAHYSHDRRLVMAALRRIQKRREELGIGIDG